MHCWLHWCRPPRRVTSNTAENGIVQGGLVILDTLFSRRDIKSADDLYDALGLGKLIPSDWNSFYPSIDCEKALRRMCRFIFIDCKDNQKRYGISAYNKLKHGLTLVSYGKRYNSNLPDAPAILIQNRQQNSSQMDRPKRTGRLRDHRQKRCTGWHVHQGQR